MPVRGFGLFRPARALIALFCLLFASGGALGAGAAHVRVVLDTSKSMSTRLRDGSGPNDPGRLAVLATMLLYDLVDPNPRRPEHPDSFVVFPFQADWPRWTDPGLAPPSGTGTPIGATGQDPAAREAFWQALHGLRYDGAWTYFYPGLRAALDSLLAAGGGPDDRRVLILVTDGLPEPEVKAREAELLAGLREELLRHGVQFYVLAFGPTASREAAFFEPLFTGPGSSLGGLFVDPGGQDLVVNMTRIFAGGFGYMVQSLGSGERSRVLDLDGGVTPPKVALLALKAGGPPPAVQLQPPVTAARGVLRAQEQGAGYAVQTIEGVRPGATHVFSTDQDGVALAVLRKIDTELGLLPGYVEQGGARVDMDAGRPVRRVMAETPFVLRALARSPTGGDGNQAELNIAFRTHGPRTGGCESVWSEDFRAAVPGSRRRFGTGVTYDLRLRFPTNQTDPGAVYRGYVDVVAGFRPAPDLPEQRVGELTCERALELEVYPRLGIRARPAAATLNPATLGDGQRGCTRFQLEMDDPARLAVLGDNGVRVRGSVLPPPVEVQDGALAGAALTLDGEPLGIGAEASPWLAARTLSPAQLLAPHDLCLTLGEPRLEHPTEDLSVSVVLVLEHPPYDDFPVIEPFIAKLRVLTAQPLQPGAFPWLALWALLLPLLAALVALLLLAPRAGLPADLGYSLTAAPDDDAATGSDSIGTPPPPGTWQPLPPPAWWQRLLGISPARALRQPGGDGERVIAWLKPRRVGLFALLPGPGLRVTDAGSGTSLAPVRRLVDVEVERDYLLSAVGGGRWRLRLGYLSAGDIA